MKPTTLDSIFRENQTAAPSEPETIEIGDSIAKGAKALLNAIEAKETEKAEKVEAAYQAARSAKQEGRTLTRQASDYMRQHWQAEENREAEHEANTIGRDILSKEINAVRGEVAVLRGELRDKKYSEDEPDKLPELKPGEFYIIKDPKQKRTIRFSFPEEK
jgi:acyl-CoA reductase-like NAD-dependent aldehyde dehydrogenase